MWLHAETPVGLAEGQSVPPLAFVSSTAGLLELERACGTKGVLECNK